MNILLASSEVFPFSKTGGLADMVAALAKALARQGGNRVGIVTPLYKGTRNRFQGMARMVADWTVELGGERLTASVWRMPLEKGLHVYFVDQPDFFHREGLYTVPGQGDHPDNDRRFVFFSRAVVELIHFLPYETDVLHLHDWQVGLVAAMIARHRAMGVGPAPATCLTIHNLAYQGVFPRSSFELTGLPETFFVPEGLEFYQQMNCLKAGIMFSDQLTTVSPTYAEEILTPEFGCGLEGALHYRRHLLTGILNGVDYEEWNTEKNPSISHAFNQHDLGGKALQKRDLQREIGLPLREDLPLFASITRLAGQKGMDELYPALRAMLHTEDFQFVLLGSGSPETEEKYRQLARDFPDKVATVIGYRHALSHRIEAGADFFLMPSLYEPCGLNQMYSLRYGTIPIVRATGGLQDSITDFSEDPGHADGIKFDAMETSEMQEAIRKALAIFQDPDLLLHYRQNGMQKDFSWESTSRQYLDVFRKALSSREI